MSRNYGQHNALLCGIRAARYEMIVTLDDDLQNPPEEIGKLIAGSTTTRTSSTGRRRTNSTASCAIRARGSRSWRSQSAMGAETARNVSCLPGLPHRIRDAFATYRGPYVSIDVLLTWGTTRFSHVTVRHEPRAVGRVQLHVPQAGHARVQHDDRLQHAAPADRELHRLPVHPVRLRDPVARPCDYLANGAAVPGFAFLASIIAIFSGAQLFALGIIGEYLARMHFRSMDRPTYLVRERRAIDDEIPQ